MTDHSHLTGEMLLEIPEGEPERLFSGDPEALSREFRALAAVWHPDRCHIAIATPVFQHIEVLHRAARERLRAGVWFEPGTVTLRDAHGRLYRVRYRKRHKAGLGEIFISRGSVTYSADITDRDLFVKAAALASDFVFANMAMRDEIAASLPDSPRVVTTAAHVFMMTDKPPDMILLRDVMDHAGAPLGAEHVAWIVSSLLNLACYFAYAGLTHNDISPETCFISPGQHRAALLGGWWFGARVGAPLLAASERALEFGPPDLPTSKRGDPRVDLNLVRALGRELLGDIGGTRLSHDDTVPAPMRNWLCLASSGSAPDDYAAWRHVLRASYGSPRFMPLNLNANEIYM